MEKKDLSMMVGAGAGLAGQICPKCGAGRLFREQLSDGRVELICLNLDCDYLQVLAESEGKESFGDGFIGRMERMTEDQLRAMQEKLAETSETLRGRSKRLAGQQLAMVQTELERRADSTGTLTPSRAEAMESLTPASPKVPPQFNTPQATARRLEGIRNYHRRQRAGRSKSQPQVHTPLQSASGSMMGIKSTQWLDRLLKTLRDEALRHEQAARNYSRVPELFPLHIEHQARAFELNRVLDMLDNYVDIMDEQNAGLSL